METLDEKIGVIFLGQKLVAIAGILLMLYTTIRIIIG